MDTKSMDLNQLYSSERTGAQEKESDNDPRSEFQKDFDRIIFSSPFRRLQNKTQVFPLPGSVFVHNRLTHSLEVASVGRSLGALVGKSIVDQYGSVLTERSKHFYSNDLQNVIASAGLCHDIGNPALGHSGEDAISTFFEKDKMELRTNYDFSDKEWADFINYEGNANAIRVLSSAQNGKLIGGLKLTYSTLAAIAKYPCEAIARDKDILHRKKFGFFQSCRIQFQQIAQETGMLKESESPVIYKRHPFVWLVEIADDICYNVIDLEDAQKLGIISFDKCLELLHDLIVCLNVEKKQEIELKLAEILDENERIAYLRAKAINSLLMACKEQYILNFERIMKGTLDKRIFAIVEGQCIELEKITKFSIDYIYNNRNVVEIENAGYNIMNDLLLHLLIPVLKSEKNIQDKKAVRLIPKQFLYEEGTDYQKVLGVLDYLSGMTDNYANDMFRRIKGIDIGMKI